MQGVILSAGTAQGIILGDDGVRYTFTPLGWRHDAIRPEAGMRVDFEVRGSHAVGIYPVPGAAPSPPVQPPAAPPPATGGYPGQPTRQPAAPPPPGSFPTAQPSPAPQVATGGLPPQPPPAPPPSGNGGGMRWWPWALAGAGTLIVLGIVGVFMLGIFPTDSETRPAEVARLPVEMPSPAPPPAPTAPTEEGQPHPPAPSPAVQIEISPTSAPTPTAQTEEIQPPAPTPTAQIEESPTPTPTAGHVLAKSIKDKSDTFKHQVIELRTSLKLENTFAAISAGTTHTCGLRESGEVVCWGSDEDGMSTPPGGRFKAISAGAFHTCGLRESGEAVCWGSVKDGMSTPPGGRFKAISAAGILYVDKRGEYLTENKNGHTCGLRNNGTIICWGTGGGARQLHPLDGNFKEISTGPHHVCGLRENGNVSCSRYGLPEGKFKAISAGPYHTCGIQENDEVVCSDEGIRLEGKYKAISAAGAWDSVKDAHYYVNDKKIYRQKNLAACGISDNGRIVCKNANPPEGTYKAISSSAGHGCALRVDGAVVCWRLGTGWGLIWKGQLTPPGGKTPEIEGMLDKWISEADMLRSTTAQFESSVRALSNAARSDNDILNATVAALTDSAILIMERADKKMETVVENTRKSDFRKSILIVYLIGRDETIEAVYSSSYEASRFAGSARRLVEEAQALLMRENIDSAAAADELNDSAVNLYDLADTLSNEGFNADVLYEAAESLSKVADSFSHTAQLTIESQSKEVPAINTKCLSTWHSIQTGLGTRAHKWRWRLRLTADSL